MGMNPFKLKPASVESCYVDLKTLNSKPYNKNTTDPYTKLRIILMNGTEYEQVWCQHHFSRRCSDNELRREVAAVRRSEQQQQKRISSLKPANETILEHTIAYEMLAVDLTASLAKNEVSPLVINALNFALLEDFDHLYRYSDLLEGERGIKAEKLVGKYIEIMPGRPTISEHRHPYDDIKPHITADADPITKLTVGIITAAEQQTMNYYMNIAAFYDTEAGRKLYGEIAMIEEQHVSQYGSLIDTMTTPLECLLMHEYTECYLYYSCFESESDTRIKGLWEELFEQEVAHLHKAAELLQKYEGKQWEQVIPNGAFPKLLMLEPSVDYVRDVLQTVRLTAELDEYVDIDKLPNDARFFGYQNTVIGSVSEGPSHKVIKSYIAQNEKDYRFQKAPHPIEELQDRSTDNTRIGRMS